MILRPIHNIICVINWLSTIVLLIGVAARTTWELVLIDLCLTAIGAAGWGFVAYKWHDRALLVINAVALVILLGGILKHTVLRY